VNHLSPERDQSNGPHSSSTSGLQPSSVSGQVRPASFEDLPIRRKVTAVIMLTSVTVLLLTAASFIIYDFITYRQMMVRSLSTVAAIIASHSGPAVAAQDQTQASNILGSLHGAPNIEAAALYDSKGKLLAVYPAQSPPAAFPQRPESPSHRFKHGQLWLFQPVTDVHGTVGTLYVASELRPLFERLRLYGAIALLVLFGSVLVTLAL